MFVTPLNNLTLSLQHSEEEQQPYLAAVCTWPRLRGTYLTSCYDENTSATPWSWSKCALSRVLFITQFITSIVKSHYMSFYLTVGCYFPSCFKFYFLTDVWCNFLSGTWTWSYSSRPCSLTCIVAYQCSCTGIWSYFQTECFANIFCEMM